MHTWMHTKKKTKKKKKRQEDRARGSLIAHQAASGSWQEASIGLRLGLPGPPVDYSGRDKLPGASIHSEQPPPGLLDT